jgi:hypothetical protein
MRLKPPVSENEASGWLREQAVARWGEVTPQQERSLTDLAKAMAAISAVEIPESTEP